MSEGSFVGWLTSLQIRDSNKPPFEPASDLGDALQRGLWDEPAGHYQHYIIECQPAANGETLIQDAPGEYVLLNRKVVDSDIHIAVSKDVVSIDDGECVTVNEVVTHKASKRVRGRINIPAGWISLGHTKTLFRWAKPEASSKCASKTKANVKTKFQGKTKATPKGRY